MGHIVITGDDGSVIKRDLASVIILDTSVGEPRELMAMREAHRVLSAVAPDEARRVVTWLCEVFPEVRNRVT